MKYLSEPKLTKLSNFLTGHELGDRIINGRIEAFSCKRGGDEKIIAKSVDTHMDEILATSPAEVASPFGPITDSNVRRLITDLIFTMNQSFPDYDFSLLRPDQFQREKNVPLVMNKVNTYLSEVCEDDSQSLLDEIWSSVDEVIQIRECEVYSYIPDLEGDPFSDGNLWSFNYFFHNKSMKRIVYFTCMAESLSNDENAFDDEDDDIRMDTNQQDDDMFTPDWDEEST
mmetsp:Transcript_26855/g.42149  ORF Transcript_26855/g.42149 Transcript_26855/m.42149 type:complete len:228 (+) Transcript_26855:87-770(+)